MEIDKIGKIKEKEVLKNSSLLNEKPQKERNVQ